MKIIKPNVFTDASLISSTVAEDDYPVWVTGTTYAIGDRRIRTQTHRIYERVSAGAGSVAPELDLINWLDIGPTNRWAAFDDEIGTKTTGASPLVLVLSPGMTTGLILFELSARTAQVTMKDSPGGTLVYEKFIDLDGTIIESFYDWFFTEFEPMTDVVLTDLPGQFYTPELTISLVSTSGNPSVGVLKPGNVIDIGETLSGARVGISDYSIKKKDERFGTIGIVERAYSKKGSFSVITEKSRFNKIFRTLASLRATPCAYIGTESLGYQPLLIYGFFADFYISIEYYAHHLCNLEIEGLI